MKKKKKNKDKITGDTINSVPLHRNKLYNQQKKSCTEVIEIEVNA